MSMTGWCTVLYKINYLFCHQRIKNLRFYTLEKLRYEISYDDGSEVAVKSQKTLFKMKSVNSSSVGFQQATELQGKKCAATYLIWLILCIFHAPERSFIHLTVSC